MKTFAQIYKKNPPTHEEEHHGWTNQVSYCGFAQWWDCNFWCSNPKLNPKTKILSCRCCENMYGVPDFNKCKKMRRKLK